MKDVLEEIVAHKRMEVAEAKERMPLKVLEGQLESLPPTRSMSLALKGSDCGIIAEFKRRSPSKGWIKEEGQPDVIPPSYARNGASALSILTDEKYFGGRLDFIAKAKPLTGEVPILRKEFIIDSYQVVEARAAGADAILLIAACLGKEDCRSLALLARELGLEVLLELHGEHELDYADVEVAMVGVNNRNLGCFVTDVQHSFDMIDRLPRDGRVLVSESGLSDPMTVVRLREAGYRGFLMGEQFMKQENPGEALAGFISKMRGA